MEEGKVELLIYSEKGKDNIPSKDCENACEDLKVVLTEDEEVILVSLMRLSYLTQEFIV